MSLALAQLSALSGSGIAHDITIYIIVFQIRCSDCGFIRHFLHRLLARSDAFCVGWNARHRSSFATISFCGVLAGTLCLPKSSRRIGSVFLLGLGLIYYSYMLVSMDIFRNENNSFPFVSLIPLAAGDLIASIMIW